MRRWCEVEYKAAEYIGCLFTAESQLVIHHRTSILNNIDTDNLEDTVLYRKILPLCLLILCLPILAARADGETDAAEADAANDAAEAASHTFLTVDGLSDGCSAADCAAFLRGECDAALVQTVAAATDRTRRTGSQPVFSTCPLVDQSTADSLLRNAAKSQ